MCKYILAIWKGAGRERVLVCIGEAGWTGHGVQWKGRGGGRPEQGGQGGAEDSGPGEGGEVQDFNW